MQLSQIKSVYEGKINACHCGCSGTHSQDTDTIKKLFTKLVNDERTIVTKHNAYLETARKSFVLYFH